MSRVRHRVYYSGRVQGVGFRDTCQRLASGHAVGGYVRNLADGRVELVAEGQEAEVVAFLLDIGDRMGDFVRDIQVVVEPPDDTDDSEFSIRY